ncbi:hypothetical protein [uncultured Jatrophihabitans sp.]|uniref:hypothetical protein n=1 Tax=uncultured Jatrophihabitans sp. TaxID=1610747 RepID=UPI0035C999F7
MSSVRALRRGALVLAIAALALLVVSAVFAVLNDDFSRVLSNVFGAAFPAVGLIITRARPRNAVAWTYLVASVLSGLEDVGSEVGPYGLKRGWPDAVVHTVAWAQAWAWFPAFFLVVTIGLLRFPDGLLLNRRWRWVERAAYAAMAVWSVALGIVAATVSARELLSADAPQPRGWRALLYVPAEAMFFLILPVVLACVGSLIARYRRGRAVEREQLRWVLSAAVLAIVLALGQDAGTSWFGPWPGWAQTLCEGVGLALIAVATGVAITRYKLYEIERIVSRTVSYAVVLVVLAGLYVGVLLCAVQFSHLNNVGVAAATLLVSIVAVPLTRRVRRVVDRRFNRSRFDAERVVTAFAGRLRARPEQGDVPTDLLTVVDRTVAPAHAAVWVVPQ